MKAIVNDGIIAIVEGIFFDNPDDSLKFSQNYKHKNICSKFLISR